MVWFIFQGESRTIKSILVKQPSLVMRVPVMLLAISCLWFFVSWNPFDFKGWMMTGGGSQSPSSLWIMIFSIVWVGLALLLSWYIFRKPRFKTNDLFRNAFYIDKGYERVFPPVVSLSSIITAYLDRKWIDKGLHAIAYGQVMFAHVVGWIDHIFIDGTVNGVARLAGIGGKFTRSFQGGNIQLYVFWAIFTIIIFIIWLVE
jgi:NADH-quinone oxidoreductase subunit L